MPKNNCYAGVCAWLITSDAICRKNFVVSTTMDNLAKRQANTLIYIGVLHSRGVVFGQRRSEAPCE
jgi:hypothetical protein